MTKLNLLKVLAVTLITLSISCSNDETNETKSKTSKTGMSNDFLLRTSTGVKELASEIYYDSDFKNYLSINITKI